MCEPKARARLLETRFTIHNRAEESGDFMIAPSDKKRVILGPTGFGSR